MARTPDSKLIERYRSLPPEQLPEQFVGVSGAIVRDIIYMLLPAIVGTVALTLAAFDKLWGNNALDGKTTVETIVVGGAMYAVAGTYLSELRSDIKHAVAIGAAMVPTRRGQAEQ